MRPLLHVLSLLAAAPLGAAGSGVLLSQFLPLLGGPVGALWGALLLPTALHLLLRGRLRPTS